jgi:hypothetical protein
MSSVFRATSSPTPVLNRLFLDDLSLNANLSTEEAGTHLKAINWPKAMPRLFFSVPSPPPS